MKQVRLKDLGRWYSGGTPPRDDDAAWEGDLPWISAKDIDSTRLREFTTFITEDAAARHSRIVPADSLVMIVRGMALAHGLAVVRTAERIAFNQDLRALVPAPGHDSRFLHYALIGSRRGLGAHIDKAAHGTARVVDGIYTDRIPVPEYRTQRVIADFLDRECARIDDLRAGLEAFELASSRRADVLSWFLERHRVEIPSSLEEKWSSLPGGWHAPLLGRVVRQLTNGYVGPTRDLLVQDGVPYIQSTHVKGGRIEFARRPYYVSREWHDAHPRINLVAKDVVIVQTGKLGETALVPDGYGPASCHALLIARAETQLTTGDYLAAWFQTDYGRSSLLRVATGALHPHLEAGEIRKVRLLLPPPQEQCELVRAASVQRERSEKIDASRAELRACLDEYRDALITEAVTGRIDVTRMSDARMDERLHEVRDTAGSAVVA